MEIKEIRDYKEHYIDLYNNVRKEQTTDQEYRDDTFKVPEVKLPHKPLRSGIGARVVEVPAEQIVSSNPQAFFKHPNKEIVDHLSKETNYWIDILKRQNPNPFKESLKNPLLRGETFIQLMHNEMWTMDDPVRTGLPVLFLIPDPMVVFASPEEDSNGVPLRVLVIYERQFSDVILRYPDWSNPNNVGPKNRKKTVSWFEYIDKDIRYWEADDVPVLDGGIQENIYKMVPFVRKYSGFGRRSPDGELANLIVSDLRFSRDMIREECTIRSDIASTFHLFAHPKIDLILPMGSNVNANEIRQNYKMGSGQFNVLELPEGSKLEEGLRPEPTVVMTQHLAEINARIERQHPYLMAGFPFGSSGRQQDMSATAAMRRYDGLVENVENGYATAIEMALKICNIVPTLKPDGLRQEDLDAGFKCSFVLRAEDPLERDRLVTLGDRLWGQGNGSISLETFHTKFQGMTQEESRKEVAKMLADKVTLYNPDVNMVMGMAFAEEAGMGDWLEAARERTATQETQEKSLQEQPAKTTRERTQGEVETGIGREQIDLALTNKGMRNPPQRFERGS